MADIASAVGRGDMRHVVARLERLPYCSWHLKMRLIISTAWFFDAFDSIAIAYVLFVRGLAYVTATQASLTGMLEPVSNPIWVFLFLGERPSLYAIGGAAVVLAAIGWHTLTAEPVAEMPAVD